MKGEDVKPGTIYPLLENMLCFLPEHLKKKLCCVTPLGETVRLFLSILTMQKVILRLRE